MLRTERFLAGLSSADGQGAAAHSSQRLSMQLMRLVMNVAGDEGGDTKLLDNKLTGTAGRMAWEKK